MNWGEINFAIDVYGKVSKIYADSILEVQQQQADELLMIKETGDVEAYKRYVEYLRDIRFSAKSDLATTLLTMASGAGP